MPRSIRPSDPCRYLRRDHLPTRCSVVVGWSSWPVTRYLRDGLRAHHCLHVRIERTNHGLAWGGYESRAVAYAYTHVPIAPRDCGFSDLSSVVDEGPDLVHLGPDRHILGI